MFSARHVVGGQRAFVVQHGRLVATTACRFASTAAAQAPKQDGKASSDAASILPHERAEHDAFGSFLGKTCHVQFLGTAPTSTLSTSRLMRLAERPRSIIKRRAAEDEAVRTAPDEAAADAAEAARTVTLDQVHEAAAAFDFRGARGLFATRDFESGEIMLAAPVHSVAISVETLAAEHVKSQRYATDAAAATAFSSLPDAVTVQQIVNDMMIRDDFYQHQLRLAAWIAWERCDPASPVTPYFNTLPVPAVDDDVVLYVHAGGLSSLQATEYLEYHQDFLYALKRIRASWLEKIGRLPVPDDQKQAAQARVPPIQVLDWAWRIVMSRQVPIPPVGIAPEQSCFRGTTSKSVHYTQWMELTGQHASLMPALIPGFDLVNHNRTPNCELDVLMRPLNDDVTVDVDAAYEHTELLLRHERLGSKGIKNPLTHHQAHHRKGGFQHILQRLNKLKRLADRAQQAIVGATAGNSVEEEESPSLPRTIDNKIKRAKTRDQIVRRIAELESEMAPKLAPVMELRSTRPIKAGEPLEYHYALLHSRAFTLYRFGFEPV